MEHWLARTELLIGEAGLAKLADSHVVIFGIGGVGSFVAEGLARAGIGRLTLVDDDLISVTNINRQLPATTNTVGRLKVVVMQERILSINPAAVVTAIPEFYRPDNAAKFWGQAYDYSVDAIDTITSKIDLIMCAQAADIPVISAMGAGNKLNPAQFEVADIYQTSVCPLAKVMRKELRARGVTALKVVYSKEQPQQIETVSGKMPLRRQVPGSMSFVPGVAGMIIAGEVVKDLLRRA